MSDLQGELLVVLILAFEGLPISESNPTWHNMPWWRYPAQRYVTCVFLLFSTVCLPIVCPVSPEGAEAARANFGWASAASGGEAPVATPDLEATPDLLQHLSRETPSHPDAQRSQINQDKLAVPPSDTDPAGTPYGASRRTTLDTGLRLSPSSAFRIVSRQRKTVSDSTRSEDNIRSSSLSKSTIADGEQAITAVENTRDSFDFPPPVPLSVDLQKTAVEPRSRNTPENGERESLPDRVVTIPTGRSSGTSLATEVGLSSGGAALREHHSFPYSSDVGELRTSMSHSRPAFPFTIPTRGGSSMQSTDHGVSSTEGPTTRDRASVDSYTSQSNSGMFRNAVEILSNPALRDRELLQRGNQPEAWRTTSLTEPHLVGNSAASFVDNLRKRKGILEPQARKAQRQQQPVLVEQLEGSSHSSKLPFSSEQTAGERFVRVKAANPQTGLASLPNSDSLARPFDINQPLRYIENFENSEVYHTLASWQKVIESARVKEHHIPKRFEDLLPKIFGSKSTSIRDIIEFGGLRKVFAAHPTPWDPQLNEYMLEYAAAIGYNPEGTPSVFTPEFCLEASRTLKSLQTQSERNYAIAKKYFSSNIGEQKFETLSDEIIRRSHLALIWVGEYLENAAHLSKAPYSEERDFAGFKAYEFYTWFFAHFSSLHEKSLDDRLRRLAMKNPGDLKEMSIRYTTTFIRNRLDAMKSPQKNRNRMQALALFTFTEKEEISKEVLDEANLRLSKLLAPGVNLYREAQYEPMVEEFGSTVTDFLTHEKLGDLISTQSPTHEAYSDHIENLLVVAQILQDGRGLTDSTFMKNILKKVQNRIGSQKYYERVEEIESKANEIKLFTKLAEHMGWTSPFTRDPTKIEAVKVQVLLSNFYSNHRPAYETARVLVRRFHPNDPQAVWDDLITRAMNQVQSEYQWLARHLEGSQILSSQMNDVNFEEWLQDAQILGPPAWASIRTDTDSPPQTRQELLKAIKPMAEQYEKIKRAGEWREMKGFIDRFMTETFRAKVDWISHDLQLEKPWLDVLNPPKARAFQSQLFRFLNDPTNAHVVSLVVRTIDSPTYEQRKRFILILEESRNQGLIRNMR
ncbi:uncharacterized protein MELLADRAFT_60609 [Melampsora larici-populina 98AG31]|uniref:Secreted protein n=1 Tax=Melampsora larici-populina (strain 98AG31 / pathotype 3-4-7) TaxID=747676 RepID=F4RBP5_MELLP|nr:uncharacterized protein MELLADRAFT_60609 [Melampsora larici-populina 98AG31]EGG10137.1 hypothetical protein MELLADRAFT_60609 [Melampsora larici-populina 98AG31]